MVSGKSHALGKAREAKRKNDQKRKAKTAKLVGKAKQNLAKGGMSVTEACRKAGIATDKYYRHLRKTLEQD